MKTFLAILAVLAGFSGCDSLGLHGAMPECLKLGGTGRYQYVCVGVQGEPAALCDSLLVCEGRDGKGFVPVDPDDWRGRATTLEVP
jgi:hypothetical protein